MIAIVGEHIYTDFPVWLGFYNNNPIAVSKTLKAAPVVMYIMVFPYLNQIGPTGNWRRDNNRSTTVLPNAANAPGSNKSSETVLVLQNSAAGIPLKRSFKKLNASPEPVIASDPWSPTLSLTYWIRAP
jgi:hypothetical protein